MPIYQYRCPECGSEQDDFNRVDDRHEKSPVCACGTKTVMVITPVRGSVQPDAHYICPATGEQVTTWRKRRDTFAEHGLMDARDISKPTVRAERKARKQRELERAMRECPQVAEAVDLVKKAG